MLVMLGRSQCNYCQNVINEKDDYVAIPSFIANKKDKLYNSGILMHRECFEKLKNYKLIEKLYNELSSNFNKTCFICNKSINHPDEYYNLTVLSSDENNFLYKYNYKEFHKACYFNSDLRNSILKKINEVKKVNQWESSDNKEF